MVVYNTYKYCYSNSVSKIVREKYRALTFQIRFSRIMANNNIEEFIVNKKNKTQAGNLKRKQDEG